MEFTIKTLIIFMLALITAIIIVALIMGFSGESGNLMEQIFSFFRNLIPS